MNVELTGTSSMSPQSFDANKTFAARLLPAQWFGIISTLVIVGAITWGGLLDIKRGIADADAKATTALSQANEAVIKASNMRTDIQSTLVSLSGQIGRMEGSLDAIKELLKSKTP